LSSCVDCMRVSAWQEAIPLKMALISGSILARGGAGEEGQQPGSQRACNLSSQLRERCTRMQLPGMRRINPCVP